MSSSQRSRTPTISAYLGLLQQDPAEPAALLNALLVHVSAFERDPAVWHALAAQVLPDLQRTALEHRSDSICLGAYCLFRGSRAIARGVSPLHFATETNSILVSGHLV